MKTSNVILIGLSVALVALIVWYEWKKSQPAAATTPQATSGGGGGGSASTSSTPAVPSNVPPSTPPAGSVGAATSAPTTPPAGSVGAATSAPTTSATIINAHIAQYLAGANKTTVSGQATKFI